MSKKKEDQKALPAVPDIPVEPKMAKLVELDLPNKGMIPIPVLAICGEGEVDLNEISKYGNFVHVLTARGTMLYTKTDLFESLVDAPHVKTLGRAKETLSYDLAKIPHKLIAVINHFFQAVYNKYHSEAMVLLYYDPNEKEWMAFCPKQEVSFSSINYENPSPVDIDTRFLRMGSWHSHASMSAFHSGTDSGDEFMAGTGVHLTSGDFEDSTKLWQDRITKEWFESVPEPEISASIVSGETRFTIDVRKILDCDTIKVKKGGSGGYKGSYTQSWKETESIIGIDDDPGVPEEWLSNVSKRSYEVSGKGAGAVRGSISGGSHLPYMEDSYEDWEEYRDYQKSYGASSDTKTTDTKNNFQFDEIDGIKYVTIDDTQIALSDVIFCTSCAWGEMVHSDVLQCVLTGEYLCITDGDHMCASLCSTYEDDDEDLVESSTEQSSSETSEETSACDTSVACDSCQLFWNCFKPKEQLSLNDCQCETFMGSNDELEKFIEAEESPVCKKYQPVKEMLKH